MFGQVWKYLYMLEHVYTSLKQYLQVYRPKIFKPGEEDLDIEKNRLLEPAGQVRRLKIIKVEKTTTHHKSRT